jgi:hypothetical protein
MANESLASFVLRIEQKRHSLAANEEATLHCFVSKLDTAMQTDLEAVRKTKATLHGVTITWKDVVSMARDKLTQTPLIITTPPAPAPPRATR